MDELADFYVICECCWDSGRMMTRYRPKIQGGVPMLVCPICKATERQEIEQK